MHSAEALLAGMRLKQVNTTAYEVKPVTFRDLRHGVSIGIAYALDRLSYQRFAPLVDVAGVPRIAFDWTPKTAGAVPLLVIAPKANA